MEPGNVLSYPWDKVENASQVAESRDSNLINTVFE